MAEKPKRSIAVAGLVLILAAFETWSTWRTAPVAGSTWSAILAIAAVALLLRQRWARWLIIANAGVAWILWIWIVIGTLLARGWPYADVLQNTVSLIPGVAWLAAWAGVALALLRPSMKQRA